MSFLIVLLLVAAVIAVVIYQRRRQGEEAQARAAADAQELDQLREQVRAASYSVAVRDLLEPAISEYQEASSKSSNASEMVALAAGRSNFKAAMSDQRWAHSDLLSAWQRLIAIYGELPWTAEDIDPGELEAVKEEVADRVGSGNCSVVVSTVQADPHDVAPLETDWVKSVAVWAGMTPSVADAFVTRIQHVGPQPLVQDASLDGAVLLKTQLEGMGLRAQVKEGRVGQSGVRAPIPESVRHEVWRRDEGRCVDCGSRENLEYDHIIAVSRGGSNTTRNIELRCESCNRKKGATI